MTVLAIHYQGDNIEGYEMGRHVAQVGKKRDSYSVRWGNTK